MASITQYKTKTGTGRAIQFTFNGRRTIRFGACTKQQIMAAKLYIENLINCRKTGSQPLPSVQEWLQKGSASVLRSLAKTGLIEPGQQDISFKRWTDNYIQTKKQSRKPSTIRGYTMAASDAIACWGISKTLRNITPQDGDKLKQWMINRGLAPATISVRIGRCKQFLRAAILEGVITRNPLHHIRTGDVINRARQYHVTREQAAKVLEACPNDQWRLVFALSRFGGLRIPSEINNLVWDDIDFARGRFTVRSPKTASSGTGGVRIVPIFPELRPHMEAVYQARTPGVKRVITLKASRTNLRTTMRRAIKKAGYTPWEKTFQNCRASRETELLQEYPINTVADWIGHTPQIALRHYATTPESVFLKAAGKNDVKNDVD